jgi:Tfp pilus assembly protein FimT
MTETYGRNNSAVCTRGRIARRCESGFSMVDLCITLALIAAMSCIALLNAGAVIPSIRANKAMNQTVSQLRLGRNMAITQRRSIQLVFSDGNRIRLIRNEYGGGTAEMATEYLENGFQFMLFDGVSDTPDGFGNLEAVYFPGAEFLTFLPDGTLVDQAGNPVNGTVFLGSAEHPELARAVTVLGATGRIRGYRWTGTEWIK